jgi:hypothetical protein
MTYPQPQMDQVIIAGGNQWRLFTAVGGPGEIYEISAPCTSLAIGPESDFAAIQIQYLDTTIPTTLFGTVRVTPQYPFAAGLTPRLETFYPLSSKRRGRMFASLIDNFNTGYLPAGFDVTKDFITRVTPLLDLVGWQQLPPTLPQKRGDKYYLFQEHQATTVGGGGTGSIWRVIPTFGRKYAFVDFFNNSAGGVSLTIRGVNFSTVSNPNPLGGPPRDDSETSLLASTVVASGARQNKIIRASADGVFDSLAVNLAQVGGGTIANAPLRVYLSDDAL